MSQPAARMTDVTAHGGIVMLGFPLVLIGCMPAARMGDMHVCPMVTPAVPPVPHVGGPVVMGSFTVLVGGQPAARMGDTCVCTGPPDVIMMGAMTTLVGPGGGFSGSSGGASGLDIGRVLTKVKKMRKKVMDTVEKVATWAVKAVQDAAEDGGYLTSYGPGIEIRGTPEFQAQVVADLNSAAATEAGQQALQRLADSGQTTAITQSDGDSSVG
jgi:uncharacterized Zn-binding protein involved in type VI secretion